MNCLATVLDASGLVVACDFHTHPTIAVNALIVKKFGLGQNFRYVVELIDGTIFHEISAVSLPCLK